MDSDSDSSSISLDEEYYTTPEEEIEYDQKFEAPVVNSSGDSQSNTSSSINDASNNGTQTSIVAITTTSTPNLQNQTQAIKVSVHNNFFKNCKSNFP